MAPKRTQGPSAGELRARQEQRRYAGSPLPPAGGGATFEDFMRRAAQAQYGDFFGPYVAQGWLNPRPGLNLPQVQQDPEAAYRMALEQAMGRPMWQYRPGGQGPLAGVPYDAWPDYMDVLGATLPWAQLYQSGAQADAARALQREQMQQALQRWQQEFAAGRQDQNFANWLATQRLGLEGRAQDFARGNQDFANWLATQRLGLDRQQLEGAMRQWDQQFAAGRDDTLWNRGFQEQQANRDWDRFMRQFGLQQDQFGLQRDESLWNRNFQEQQANRAWDRWQQEFGAGRDDAMWGRGFQEKQADRAWDRWQQEFGAGRDDEMWGRGFRERQQSAQEAAQQWSQAFQQAGFDWQKEMDKERNKLQEQGQFLGAFGRKFGPAYGSM